MEPGDWGGGGGGGARETNRESERGANSRKGKGKTELELVPIVCLTRSVKQETDGRSGPLLPVLPASF